MAKEKLSYRSSLDRTSSVEFAIAGHFVSKLAFRFRRISFGRLVNGNALDRQCETDRQTTRMKLDKFNLPNESTDGNVAHVD